MSLIFFINKYQEKILNWGRATEPIYFGFLEGLYKTRFFSLEGFGFGQSETQT